MRLANYTWLAVLAVTVSACHNKSKDEAAVTERTVFFDKSGMDTIVKPGDNFFLYANGKWVKETKIPPSETGWGAFNILYNDNQKDLHNILDDLVTKDNTK